MEGRDFSAELFGSVQGRDFGDELFGPAPQQSFFRQVADVPLGVAKGAVQGVRMIADAFGAGSDTSQTIKGAEEYLGGLMSAAAKKDQQEIARLMKDAEDKGVLDQVKAGFQAFATAPVDLLTQAFGTAVPVILGTLGAKLLGAGAGIATGVSALTGAGMGAGVVKGSIYEETKRALIEAGAQPEEAERRAQLAQEYGGKNLDQILLGTALGGVAAVGPLEKGAAGALARRILGKVSGEEVAETTVEQAAKGALRRRAEAAGLEAVPEALQAGQERVAQNIALQREGFEDVPTFRGAAGAATLEGLAGAGLGAMVGRPQAAPEVEPPAPEAPPIEPPAPPRALEFRPEPYIQFPDGTVAKQSEVEAYIKTLPEDQQMEMRTKLLGLAPQEAEKEPAPPVKALEFKPEPLIVYPDGSVAKRSEVDAYIQGLPEDEQISARAKLLGMGEEVTQVTPEMLRKLGIRGRAPIIQRLSGLELTDPKVREELTNFAEQPFASPEVRGNIFGFLNTIKVTPATPVAPPVSEAPPAPTPVEPPAPPVTPPAPPAPTAPFTAPGGFVSRLTLSPAYEGIEPLSVEDADFELEALQNRAKKGRLTPEQFAGSEIGKRLDTARIAFINEGLRADPVGTITALRDRLKEATAAPPDPPVEPAPVAPSPRVEKTPVSQRVGEGAALRPEGGVEPSVAEDRELVIAPPVEPVPVVEAAAPVAEAPAAPPAPESDQQALEEKRQMVADMIETKKANREAVPEAWIKRLADLSAQLRGETISDGETYSMEVAGHPLFDGPPVLRNLIPIKVKDSDAAQRALDRALDLEKQFATEFYGANQALKSARTAAEKKSAQTRIKKLNDQGWDEDALKTLRNETIQELSRLVDVTQKAAPKAEAPAAEAPAAPAKLAAPEVHEDQGVVEPATPEVIEEAADKGKQNTNLSPAEMRKNLTDQIDRAIASAPEIDDADITVGKMVTSRGKKEVSVSRVFDTGTVEIKARELRHGVFSVESSKYEGGMGGRKVIKLENIGGPPASIIDQLTELARRAQPDATVTEGDYVTFEVPGDGTFRVLNNKSRLAEFKKKVETNPGFKAPKKPTPSTAPLASSSKAAAIKDMIDGGDPQAAVDYAAATGVDINDLLKNDRVRSRAISGLEPTTEDVGPKDIAPRKYDFLTTSEPAIDSDRIPSYKRGVETLRRKLDRGEITTDEFANRVDFLAKQVEKARLAKDIPDRERGADYIRQRLLEAKRRGDLSAEAVDFAEWFILKNPKLVDDLAISIRSPEGDGTAGVYNKMARIAVLMKDSSKDTTAVHEILHHLERMMPKEVQSAIRKSWAKSLAEAQKKATTDSDKQFFQHVLDYNQSRKQSDLNKAEKLIQDGKVDYTNYQYINPSEFWAVNGTDIMQGRFDVKGSLLGRLKQWLSELTEKAKDLFGLDNKAAIIRALDSLSKGDGKFVTTEMLSEFAVEPKDIRAKAAKAREDIIEAGRLGMQKRVPIQGGRLGEDINSAINKVFVPENATLADKIENFKDRTWQRIAQGVADQFRTIKQYSEKGYMIATTSKSVDGAMETLLRYGELYNDGGALNVRKDTRGLLEALTPLGKEVDTFFVWLALNREASQPDNKKSEFIDPDTGEDLLAKLVAKRNELNQGKIKDPKTGFMVDRAVVYEKARKDMMKLNRSVLDIAHGKVTRKPGEKEPLLNAAIIDDEAFDKFINDAFFVPFYREMEGKGVEAVRNASGLTGQQFSKALKGSALPFADLYNNVLLNWSHILSAAMKNSAAVQTIEDALTYGGIEAVVPNLKSQFEWKNNKVYKVGTDELVGDGSLKWDQTTDDGKGVSMVMIDGNKTYFKVTDPLLFESISAIGYLGKSSKFLDMATTMAQWLRFGVTVSPVFRINNLLRDPAAAAAVAGGKLKFTPLDFVQNTIEGIRLYDPKNESYLGALAGGGIFNMGTRFEGDQSKLIKKLQAAGIKSESILDSDKKIRTALSTLWNKYEEYGNKAESAQRLKLYKTMRDKDMSHLEAVFYARDLMDYSKQGAWPAIRILMQTVPFLNARTQGLYKLGRDGIIPTARTLYNVVNGKSYDQLTEEEKKQRITDTQKAKAFSAVAGASVAASLLLYFMYKDDEDFKKRDAWDRDNFFWFKVPGLTTTSATRSADGEEVKTEVAIRIPKPFEIGALATLVERITEQIVDKNAEGKQFGDALSRMLVNTFAFDLPQIIRPAVDLYANKDNFTKAPIEGPGMERLSKAERMTPDTSPLAIMLSRGANILLPEKAEVSPLQMDYAMQAYFGWAGATVGVLSRYAMMPFNEGEYPDARWMDRASLGLVKELPGRSGGYVTSFYDNAKAINQAMADMRHYAGFGQMEKAYEIQNEKMDKIQLYGLYQKVGDIMGNIRKQINMIKVDKTMSGAEKKQAIENMQQLMSEYAKMAEDIRKQQKK